MMKKLSVLLLMAGHAAAFAQDTPVALADRLFAKWNDAATPGCAVAVAQRGQTVFKRAYGLSDLEQRTANTPDTVFEAGSVAKQFTAAAVLLLAKDGKLSLADDVRKYVPELPDYGRRITLEHLLTHTSGLRDWGVVVELEGWPRGTRAVSMEQALAVIARQRALNFAPGERYSYTNSGYVLAAFVVQRVSGKTLAEFTRERLFVPLGMKHTQWRDNFRRVVPGRAVAYSREDNTYQQDMPFEDVYGHGGLLTTVGDLLLWNEALSGQMLGEGVTRELERKPVLPPGQTSNYAHGLFVTSPQGVAEVSHGGATAGYRTWLGRFPDQQLSVALLCNAGDVYSDGLARQIAQAWLAPAATANAANATASTTATAALAAPQAADSVRPYAGTFYNEVNARKITLELRDGALAFKNGKALQALDGKTFKALTATFAFSGPDQFVARYEGGDSARFQRVAEAAPERAVLAAYEGRYHSDEVPATYRVSVDGAGLMLRTAANVSAALALGPLAPDTFGGAGYVVRFLRDAQGRVSGATVATDRLFELRFAKLPQ